MTSFAQSPAAAAETLREIMSNLAAGVTVVTCQWQGEIYGLTVSSYTSVSLDPPLVLVCIAGEARRSGIMQRAGGFTVNLLKVGAQDAASQFAQKQGDRFAGMLRKDPVTIVAGPILPEISYAYLECRTEHSLEAGDHAIFIGHVEKAEHLSDHAPLLYWRRAYAEAIPLK